MMGLEPTTFCMARTLRQGHERPGASNPHGSGVTAGAEPSPNVSRRQSRLTES